MRPPVSELYERGLRLTPQYVREVLGLTGEQAGKVGQINGGIHADEVELLGRLVDEIDPEVSVEVGLGYGFSAMTICAGGARAKSERRHIVIDPHQRRYWDGLGLKNLQDAGFGAMVELIEEPSHRALPRLELSGLKADLAFVDGWHTFDQAFVDFFYVDRLLREGGVVAFDDADWPSVRPVLRYAVTNLGYAVAATLPEKRPREAIDVELGLEGSCIALRKQAAPAREIFFHRPFY